MPINPAALGAQLVAVVQPPDPLGAVGWLAIGGVIGAWGLQTVVNATGGSTPLVSVGPVIIGTGGLIPGPAPALGLGLAGASLSVDPAGLLKWLAVATELSKWMLTSGGIDPSTLVAYSNPIPPVGPASGTAKLAFTQTADLPTAAGATDEAGIAKWTAVAQAIKSHLETFALVTPTFTNNVAGGPVLGTGTVS